jgi:hypothetical protein
MAVPMKTLTQIFAVAIATLALAPSARADDHPYRPTFTLGAEVGVGHYVEGSPFDFESGTGSVTQTGPVWGLRAGVDFLSWIGVEGRYIGMWNSANGNQGYVMSGAELVLRLALPTPYVHPYIFGGVGYYAFSLTGHDPTGQYALQSTSQPGFPMGIGVEVPITKRFSVAVEGTFRFQLGESFAPTNDEIDGADQTTLTGIFKVRL